MPRPLVRLVAAAALVAAVVRPALAEGGMPQLDFGNPFTMGQVVWGAVIFVVLFLLLTRFSLPQVSSVLEHRAETIAADLTKAQSAKAEADAAAAEMAEANRRARAEAQARVADAAAQAKQAADAQAAELNARLERQLAEAEARIAAAHQAAMGALRQVVTDTTGALVTRLTGKAANDDRVGAAVNDVMRSSGHA